MANKKMLIKAAQHFINEYENVTAITYEREFIEALKAEEIVQPETQSPPAGRAGGEAGVRRVQRKRIKGWKMPKNTIYVGRPSAWGNPYVTVKEFCEKTINNKEVIKIIKKELRGKNLACWCPLLDKKGLYVSCHADILIKVANA